MDAPPAYAAPKKKMSTCLIIGIILAIVCVCCCGGAGFFGYYFFNKGKDMVACGQGFEDLQRSLFDYAEAHDGKLPKATTWMDDIRPYYAKRLATHKDQAKVLGFIPAEGVFSCSRGGLKTSIVFNNAVSGKKIKDLKNPEGTIMIFESNTPPALNNAGKYSPLDNSTSPEIMGKHIGWFTAPAAGDVELGTKAYKSNVGGGLTIETKKSVGVSGD